MITWAICGMGGPIASGIPSEEAGRLILTDMIRSLNDEEGFAELTLKREAGQDCGEEDDRLFWVAVGKSGRQYMALSPEPERCDHCGQCKDYYHGYRGI